MSQPHAVAAAPSPRVSSSWGAWDSRNDAADYGRLARELGPRLHPARPAGRKALHIRGQIALWV
jgi:hypothetical protein